MPNNKNRDNESYEEREPQGSQVRGDATGASNEDSDEEDRESREMQSTRDKGTRSSGKGSSEDREESRQPQSGTGGGSNESKGSQVKIGNADETADVGLESDGTERRAQEPNLRPGGDGRVGVRADDRNDGKPDAPMPNLDGSRK